MGKFCDITWNQQDLSGALQDFRDDVAVKIVRASLRRLAKEEQQTLAAAAPVDSGHSKTTGRLQDNITFGTRLALGRGIVKSFVLVRTVGDRNNPRNAFYWRFVEYGHATRNGGKVAANDFIRRTFAATQDSLAAKFFSDLAGGIAKTYTRRSP